MKPLLRRRTSVSAGEFPQLVKATWPFGKVTMYEDVLVLDAGMETYTLAYADIDDMEFNALQVIVNHHDSTVPKDLTIDGPLVKRAIRQAITMHRLPIDMK